MADQYDQDLEAFLNGTMRRLCDHFAGIKQAILVAKPQYINLHLPTLNGWDPADTVVDGSQDDGRATLTVAEWKEVAGILGTIDAAITGTVFDALVKAAVNPRNPLG